MQVPGELEAPGVHGGAQYGHLEDIDHLFLLYDSAIVRCSRLLSFLGNIIQSYGLETTYTVVAGREEESRPVFWWQMSVVLLDSVVGGILGSMV